MINKLKIATDEQLNALVATCVMEWKRTDTDWWVQGDESMPYSAIHRPYDSTPVWSPSTDIACAFQVDKPEWEWFFGEKGDDLHANVYVASEESGVYTVVVPLDPANKTAAYCRGRCIAACYACGITEV